jgi:hypothetical protein
MAHNSGGARRPICSSLSKHIEFRPGGRAPLAGTMDEVSSQGRWFRFGRTMFRLFHLILLTPLCGGQRAPTSERSESLARLRTPVMSIALVEIRHLNPSARVRALVELSALREAAGERDRRHGGLCCGCSVAIKPGALAPRSAAAGLDSGTAAERSASMPFDGALGLLKGWLGRASNLAEILALPKMHSLSEQKSVTKDEGELDTPPPR